VVFLPETGMDTRTRAELQFILDARYKVWARTCLKMKRDAIKKYEHMLYSRFHDRSGKPLQYKK
jgi:hypothetical protein